MRKSQEIQAQKLALLDFFLFFSFDFLSQKEEKELANRIKAYKKRPTANRRGGALAYYDKLICDLSQRLYFIPLED